MSYASAMYELSTEQSVEEEVYESAVALKASLSEVPEYIRLLSSPLLPIEVRLETIRAALCNAPQILKNTVLLLCEKYQAGSLIDILQEFIELYEQKKGILNITACSAYSLNENMQKRLERVLQNRFQKRIRLTYEVDPIYIGGLMIKTKEFRYDGTVSSKLEDIERILLNDTNIPINFVG